MGHHGILIETPHLNFHVSDFGYEWETGCSFPSEVDLGVPFTPRIEFTIDQANVILNRERIWLGYLCYQYGKDEALIEEIKLGYKIDGGAVFALPSENALWANPVPQQGCVWSVSLKPEDLGLSAGNHTISFVIIFIGWYHTHRWVDGTYPIPFVSCSLACGIPGMDCDQWDEEGTWEKMFLLSTDLKTFSVTVNSISCAFHFEPSTPTVGQTVSFYDDSSAPAGKALWYWGFGDGVTSNFQHPTHEYTLPGTYEVSLTVTDNDGYAETCYQNISVYEAPVLPYFTGSNSINPATVGPLDEFIAYLTVKNVGGPGSIFIEAYTPQGGVKPVIPSKLIGGYSEFTIEIPAHTIAWYLNSVPTVSDYFGITYRIGLAGSSYIDTTSISVPVIVVACTNGETKCDGYNQYICANAEWELKEENSSACGYPNGVKGKSWLLLAGGLLTALGGLILVKEK